MYGAIDYESKNAGAYLALVLFMYLLPIDGIVAYPGRTIRLEIRGAANK